MTKTAQHSVKEKIEADLKQAKETGQLRADRIREIVQAAVSQVSSEVKAGSSEIRTIVRDAVSAVVDSLRGKGGEVREEITASIEGAIEGVSQFRRRSISQTQAEVKQLQSQLDQEETELQAEIDRALVDIEEVGKESAPDIKDSIAAALNSLKESEEAALLKKRYAQLQAQLAILRANLVARYGGRNEEIQEYLEDAKHWYSKARTQAEPVAEQVQQQRTHLEEKLGDAGSALARGERKVKQILRELLHSATEALRDRHSSKDMDHKD